MNRKLIAISELPTILSILYPDQNIFLADERMWGQKLITAQREKSLTPRNKTGMKFKYADDTNAERFFDVLEVAEWIKFLGCDEYVATINVDDFIRFTNSCLGEYGQYSIAANGVSTQCRNNSVDSIKKDLFLAPNCIQQTDLNFPITTQKLVEWVKRQNGDFVLPDGFAELVNAISSQITIEPESINITETIANQNLSEPTTATPATRLILQVITEMENKNKKPTLSSVWLAMGGLVGKSIIEDSQPDAYLCNVGEENLHRITKASIKGILQRRKARLKHV